jgi:hypothetical protein
MNKEFIEAIHIINKNIPGVIFCGSTALYLNNKLLRHPTDIDIIIPHEQNDVFFEFFDNKNKETDIQNNGSLINSMYANITVVKEKLNSINVDLFYCTYDENYIRPQSTIYNLDNVFIELETPKISIEHKIYYVKNIHTIKALKHAKDLEEMKIEINISPIELYNILNKEI